MFWGDRITFLWGQTVGWFLPFSQRRHTFTSTTTSDGRMSRLVVISFSRSGYIHTWFFFFGGAAGIVIAGSLGRCTDRIDLLRDVPIPIDCGWIKSTVNLSRGRVGISNAPTMTPGPRQNNIVPFSRWTNHRRLSVNNVTTMTSISETCHFGEASHRWASLLQRIRGNVRPHRVCRTTGPTPSLHPRPAPSLHPRTYRPLWL